MLWCFITTVLVATGSVLTAGNKTENRAIGYVSCELPPYPDNGRYVVDGRPDDHPGQLFTGVVFINVTCDPGYATDGPSVVLMPCYPEVDLGYTIRPCRRYCALPSHDSVDYECRTSKGGIALSRPCQNKVFVGTTVIANCRPNYRGIPSPMRCTQDGWNYIEKCTPECGITTPQGQELIIGGKTAVVGEVPWHAGIYVKTTRPFKQLCGGSIVTTKAIITAAHCLWKENEGRQSPDLYAVAVGKIYRPWNDDHDVEAQFSNVTEIHIPDAFRGSQTNFENDIGIVILETEIVYKSFIRPVCIDFNSEFNKKQLMPGNPGKIAGWVITSKEGSTEAVLRVVKLPVMPFKNCYEQSPPAFRDYLTGEKFCARFQGIQSETGKMIKFNLQDLITQRDR